MKQLFHSKKQDSPTTDMQLLLRVGPAHCAFAITDRDAHELVEIAYCSTEQFNQTEWNIFWDTYPSLNDTFHSTKACWDFPQGLIVDTGFQGNDMASILLRSTGEVCNASDIERDAVPEWQLDIIYAIAPEFKKWLRSRKPGVTFVHQYTPAVKKALPGAEAGSLLVDFRESDFVVAATRAKQVLLAQTFSYITPGDVLFHLLKVCGQFDLSQEKITVQLSGLVDQQSAMYKEVYQYFIHVDFRQPSWKTSKEFPAHFFTSFNDLAICVS